MVKWKAEAYIPVGVLRWDCSAMVIHLVLTNHRCLVQLPQCHLKPFVVGY